jgi:hypothetical protein
VDELEREKEEVMAGSWPREAELAAAQEMMTCKHYRSLFCHQKNCSFNIYYFNEGSWVSQIF